MLCPVDRVTGLDGDSVEKEPQPFADLTAFADVAVPGTPTGPGRR